MDTITSCDDFLSEFSDILVILKGDWQPLLKATKGDYLEIKITYPQSSISSALHDQ